VSLAVSIALAATNLSDIDLLAHQVGVFGDPPSDATAGAAWTVSTQWAFGKVAKVRARVRRRVWDPIATRSGGFPGCWWRGNLLTGWIAIDLDATLITAQSDKQGGGEFQERPRLSSARGVVREHHRIPRDAAAARHAGSNTVSDHIQVLADAIAQIPARYGRKILVRIDGAGATHDFLEHLQQMNSVFRTVRLTVGWTITGADEMAIAVPPATGWADSPHQDG